MDIGKWKILTASLALICSLTIPVLAYTIYTSPLYPLDTGVVLQGVTMQLGFYWDDGCTLPVTTIDFGEIQRSGSDTGSEKTIYIRNEGTDAIHIYWNSTLGSVTTAIEDDWWDMGMFMPLNVSSIPAVSHIETRYLIGIHAGVPMGTYNWTVTVWGESYV